MKKILLVCALLLAVTQQIRAQHFAVKTNALGWASALTLNAGAEVALTPRWTLDLDGYYNPFSWGHDKKTEFWGIQPEVRFWFCHKFTGHFIGLNGYYGDYDCGLWKYNYDGSIAGIGLSYGYALPIAKRWRLEFNLGAGYNRKNYEKTDRVQDRAADVVYRGHFVKNQFGITRAGINIVFVIR